MKRGEELPAEASDVKTGWPGKARKGQEKARKAQEIPGKPEKARKDMEKPGKARKGQGKSGKEEGMEWWNE